MPPKKRKAVAKPAAPASKKARIETVEERPVADEAEESLPTRPKRKSIGTPNYDLTKRHKPRTQADSGPEADDVAAADPSPPKRRGRPPKQVATEPQPTSTDAATPKRRGRPAKESTTTQPEPVSAPRGRGRPKANIKAEEVSAPAKRGRPAKTDVTTTPKGRGRPAKTVPTTNVKADANARSATKGKALPKKRGRPANTKLQTVAAPQETLDGTSGADDLDEASDDGTSEHQYWLLKAEPNDRYENGVNVKFSIDDLAAAEVPEAWDGVRNYGARNNLRAMRKGDLAFFYHSNCQVPGVVGVMRIVQEHSTDQSAFDPNHPYYDPKSSPSNPKWDCVHVEFVKKFDNQVTLKMLQEEKNNGRLANMQLLKMGRLSVSSVTPKEWAHILNMANEDVALGEDDRPTIQNDGYEPDTDGEVNDGPKEELNGDIAAGGYEADKEEGNEGLNENEELNGTVTAIAETEEGSSSLDEDDGDGDTVMK